MGTSIRETERKFDVTSGFSLPSLAGVPGVASVTDPEVAELQAVYYDTADLRLGRRKITLRRRTGGHDQGWHLKLPVATSERDEIHAPLGPAGTGEQAPAVPDRLADLVLACTLGAPLVPVARLSTRRSATRLLDASGTDLAEVVVDEVTAQPVGDEARSSSWTEVEVELAEAGDAELLDAVGDTVTAAGAAPSRSGSKLARALGPALTAAAAALPVPAPAKPKPATPAGEVIRGYLLKHYEALLTADPRVRLDEPDAVHKMRVASRRLRSTFRTFKPLFDPEVAMALDGELRDLAGALSGARDTEVQLEHFEAEIAALPRALNRGSVKRSIQRRLRSDAAGARARALAALRGDRYLKLLADLEAVLSAPGGVAVVAGAPAGAPIKASVRPARKVLPALVAKADRKLAHRVAAIEEAEPGVHRDETFHSARKQAKRLRYAAEAVEPAFGSDAGAFAKLAEDVQEVLGVHQDAVISRDLLRTWGIEAQSGGGREAFSLGVLLGQEDGRARMAERDFAEVWKEASRSRHRRWLAA